MPSVGGHRDPSPTAAIRSSSIRTKPPSNTCRSGSTVRTSTSRIRVDGMAGTPSGGGSVGAKRGGAGGQWTRGSGTLYTIYGAQSLARIVSDPLSRVNAAPISRVRRTTIKLATVAVPTPLGPIDRVAVVLDEGARFVDVEAATAAY